MMKNVRFYTIAVLFDKLPTHPKSIVVYIWIFDTGSHVIIKLSSRMSITVADRFIEGFGKKSGAGHAAATDFISHLGFCSIKYYNRPAYFIG